MDIGQPADFLKAGDMYLNYKRQQHDPMMAQGENIVENVLIDPTASISPSAKIGPNVVIGPKCVIGEGVRLAHVCVMAGTIIGKFCLIRNAILGWKCKIGNWCRIEGLSILGEDVAVKDEIHLNGPIVCPHKSITDHVRTPGTILL
jgi:mannose-1-phosphate guanylyltransferase